MKRPLNNGFKKGHSLSKGRYYHLKKFTPAMWDKWLTQLNRRLVDEAPHVSDFRWKLEEYHPTATRELC